MVLQPSATGRFMAFHCPHPTVWKTWSLDENCCWMLWDRELPISCFQDHHPSAGILPMRPSRPAKFTLCHEAGVGRFVSTKNVRFSGSMLIWGSSRVLKNNKCENTMGYKSTYPSKNEHGVSTPCFLRLWYAKTYDLRVSYSTTNAGGFRMPSGFH